MAQDKQITVDEIAQGIDRGISTADLQRGDALERLDTARQAKDTSLRREQARLSDKYGSDHPRVQHLANKVAINQAFRVQVVAETIRAKTEIPTVDQNTWVLHGFVRDVAGQGAPNLTVALYDPNGLRLHNLGQACTEANGYFKVVSKDANGIGIGAAYVRVLSGTQFLYADKSPLFPKFGRLDYREIRLTGETAVCVSPPEPPTSTGKPEDNWVVNGRVTNTKGEGLEGLMVSIFDKDLVFDDRLGQVRTGEGGYYALSYRTKDFRDLIERKPDLYLKVLDDEGKTLYSSKDTIRFAAGRIETIDVVIASSVVSSSHSDTAPLQAPIDVWEVKGHVRDLQGNPLVGYLVTAADKDALGDDALGSVSTGNDGSYSITFRKADFGRLESNPDIYITITEPTTRQVVHTSQVFFESGHVETIDATVGPTRK